MNRITKDNSVIVKHNDLIHAAQKMTVMEGRVVLCCLSQVNSLGKLSSEDKFEIHVKNMESLIDEEVELRYSDIKEAVDLLYDRSVYFLKPSARSKKPIEAKFRWLSYVEYLPNEGKVRLSFSSRIIPFISELTEHFTKYKLEYVMQFKCIYTIRFYEFFKSSMSSEKIIKLDEIKRLLEIEDIYHRQDKLQDKVIKPSLDEINKFTDITASYEALKEGRRIVAFKFTFVCLENKKAKSKPKPKFSPDRIDGVLKTDLEKYAKPGESYSQAAARIKAEQLMLEKTGKPKTVDVAW
jgi:plasmid replication initiation protein